MPPEISLIKKAASLIKYRNMISVSTQPCYQFGLYRVDTQRRVLTRGGALVALPPKAFDILLFLVQNSGRELSKQEFMEQIWPDSFVEESNLAQNIFLLRRALGEEKKEHHYIVTAPGRGYRFVAEVEEIWGNSSGKDEQVTREGTLNNQRATSLAVLPFKPLTMGEREGFLGIGLADAIIMRLSNLKVLSVRPTTSVLKYHDQRQDPLTAGRGLNVDLVLDGIYQRDGDQLRVTAQLVRTEDGTTLWAGKFDEDYTDIFAIQDSVSEQVARAIAPQFTHEENERLVKRATENMDAYQLYLIGLHFKSKGTAEDLDQAVTYLKQSITLDQNYALAYAALADAYFIIIDVFETDVSKQLEGQAKMKAAALRALELDALNGDAYACQAVVKIKYEKNPIEAERLFRRALELNPNSAIAHERFCWFLLAYGRFNEGLRMMQRAHEINPLSPRTTTSLGLLFFYAREYDESLKHLDRAISLDAQFLDSKILRALALGQKGMGAQAINDLLDLREAYGGEIKYLEALGFLLALDGNEEAIATLVQLEARARDGNVAPYNVGAIYVALNQVDKAFEWLEQPYFNWTERLRRIRFDPRFDVLRAGPRFAALFS